MMSEISARRSLQTLSRLLILAALGCATTGVEPGQEYAGRMPRPERILVHPFATASDEIKLDHGATAGWKLHGVPESEEQKEVGRAVSQALANELVKKIQSQGLPAELAEGPPPDDGRPTLVIQGHFLAIDEGSRTQRVVIGLGAGHSEVRTAVQVYEVLPEGSRVIDTFEIDAKSGSAPGMLETMGAGAAGGHLAVSAAASVAKSAVGEKFGENVEADAKRTAAKIATVLGNYFARQGWIEAP
jgi:hypothetical protein